MLIAIEGRSSVYLARKTPTTKVVGLDLEGKGTTQVAPQNNSLRIMIAKTILSNMSSWEHIIARTHLSARRRVAAEPPSPPSILISSPLTGQLSNVDFL